jgi:hypothetical protein
MSEAGKQYAHYHHHSAFGRNTASYKVLPGNYQETLVLHLPAGSYQTDWIDAATGEVLRTEKLSFDGASKTVSTPAHKVDLALRIKRS